MQLCIEEAKKKGIDEEKYREMARKIYRKKSRKAETFWKKLPAVSPPRTSSGKQYLRSLKASNTMLKLILKIDCITYIKYRAN